MRLQGKVAVITGASRGIGKAIALEFAREGADVVLASRSRGELKIVAGEVEALGRRALVVECDVSKSADVSALVDQAVKVFGGLDILVNNAGVSTFGNVVQSKEEDWDYNMDINAKGTFFCSRQFAHQLIKQGRGGKIVNISSRGGRVGLEGLAHYSASKFAVVGLTQAMALELAPHLINVNAICPGRIETEMTAEGIKEEAAQAGVSEEEYRKQYYAPVPWKRPGLPEDVAHAAVFLSSSESDYITGTTLNVAGGLDVVRGGNT